MAASSGVRGLEWHFLAGIFAVVHAGALDVGGCVKLFYFVIDEQAPAGGALHPKAQDVDLAAACGDGADFAVSALGEINTGFVAERWLGDGMQDFGER